MRHVQTALASVKRVRTADASYRDPQKFQIFDSADLKFLPKVGLAKVYFILEVIWIDRPSLHLEVTVAQQSHFVIKSTVAQKW